MAERDVNRKLREATWAGIFYDDDPAELARRVDALLAKADPGGIRAARAIVSPHASLEYSGDLAALAWSACRERKISRIVIIGPWHRAKEPSLWLPESQSFEGPFGSVEVDRRSIGELLDSGTYGMTGDLPHLEEHSIEVQLPFAVRLFPGAPIVPLLVGKPSMALVKALASSLDFVFGRRASSTLVVISSDLEFAPTPTESAAKSDVLLGHIDKGDWEGLVADGLAGRLSCCGIPAIAGLMASGFAGKARLLGRHGSGSAREREDDAHGDYAAIAFE